MSQKQTIHFVEPDTRQRAELARLTLALGHHAEVYADIAELCERPPHEGILAVRQGEGAGGIATLIERLAEAGVWLPVVAMDEAPQPESVVAAMRDGALDYVALPLDSARLADLLERIEVEARAHAAALRRMQEARSRIARLSPREREVLDWLAEGSSNKTIARELSISPRTVEIHRANMMGKLGARHSAEAVRLRLEAALDS